MLSGAEFNDNFEFLFEILIPPTHCEIFTILKFFVGGFDILSSIQLDTSLRHDLKYFSQ